MLYQIFKALADSTRLRILNLLIEAPLCVCELGQVLRLPQPLLSRHLAYLKNVGLVQDQRQGMRVQYSVSPDYQRQQEFRNFLRNILSSDWTCREDLRRRRQIADEAASPLRDEVTTDLGMN